MSETEQSLSFDRLLVARNLKGTRKLQGLSQTVVAQRAGVDLSSVHRVEKGCRTHLKTLKKIALGLNVTFEDMLLDKSRPDVSHPFAIHRASRAKWFAAEDRRTRLPEGHLESYQNPAERERLGTLGFVPFFKCPPLVIPPNGPGVVLLEFYDIVPGPYNAEFYEDGALYLLRGKAAGTVGGEDFELEEGDWISFKTKDLGRFGAAPGRVATMLWIGATRLKRRSTNG